MKRPYIISVYKKTAVLLAAACVATLFAGCGNAAQEEETLSEVIPVEAQMPVEGTLTLKNEFVGTVSPEESVYVIPMVSAEVLSTEISVGDTVVEGQELCKLDTEAAELQLASAEAQYNSAAAGVQAAEVGYEIAQAQYDSTVAQLDMQNEQTQRQKDLTMYQMQMQIDGINSGIDDINEQIADLEDDKKDAKDQRDKLKKAKSQANDYVKKAQEAYNAAASAYGYPEVQKNYQIAVATVTAMESPDYDKMQHGSEEAYEAALSSAKAALQAADTALQQVE